MFRPPAVIKRLFGAVLLLCLLASLWLMPAPASADYLAPDQPTARGVDTPQVAASTWSLRCPPPDAIPKTVARADQVVLPILMYHHLHELPPTATPLSRTLTVSPRAFEEQVTYLVENNYHTIYFADLIAYFDEGKPLPRNPIILTFDDGWADAYTVAFPTLRKHCLTGAFFPPTNWVNNSRLTLTWPQIEEMSRSGMEFGSHTASHHLLTGQTAQQITQQVEDSRRILNSHTQMPVVAVAYPGGAYNAAVAQAVAKANFGAAVGVAPGVEQRADDLFHLHRVTITYADTVQTFAAKLKPPTTGPSLVSSGRRSARHTSAF